MLLAIIIFLSFAWKEHPGVVICTLFWLSVIWTTYATRLVYRPAGLLLLIGAVSNALVTVLNGGIMPVVGMPRSFSPVFPVWQAAHANRLLPLADHASLFYFSVGDFFLMAGGAAILLSRTPRWRAWLKIAVQKLP